MSTAQAKSELRKEMKAKRAELASDGYRTTAGETIAHKILELDEFLAADTVLTFYPVGNEIDVLPIFEAAKSLGKAVAFPCSLEGGKLLFREINDLSEMKGIAHNIPEPTDQSVAVSDFKSSVCITPALAFDTDGYRIGYGGGYYDRFLSSYIGTSIGVAYDEMICDSLPRDEYDLTVDIIITERRILRPCQSK